MTRLDVGVFDIPVTELRIGYRSAVYFNRTRDIMQKTGSAAQHVKMQIFQRKEDRVVCGLDEVVAILKTCAGSFPNPTTAEQLFRVYHAQRLAVRKIGPERYLGGANLVPIVTVYRDNMKRLFDLEDRLDQIWESGWDNLVVHALHDGDVVQPWEPVMTITGPYHMFAHLESVYLGILARQTKIATNTREVVDAANGKPVLFFADRFDHYATQGGDGYAAHIGGAAAHASTAMGAWWGEPGVGTMPHALIAAHNGDVVSASRAFHDKYPHVDLIGLVDFNNDCVGDSLRLLAEFGQDLKGVRLDTSGNMIDASIAAEFPHGTRIQDPTKFGVNPYLVRKVREALDAEGGEHVKIVVSGGFTAEKISQFEKEGVPVDTYAVGSGLLKGSNDFTADVVWPAVKQGREEKDASRLERVL